MKKKLIALPSVEPHDPDHKILAASIATLQTISRQKAEALARQILEEAEPLGQATAGPEPTLSALQGHQIERMVLDARFKATGWRCPKCGSLGSGGSPTACPYCQGEIGSANLREEIIAKAKAQGMELFFTEDFSPLMKAGGIGALLKYKASKRVKR
jgi:peptide subunit release factor 1 (eRF1)